ncbi:hypothetical protein HRW12_29035 [Streptomyces lunaelactis]|uniref:hypothetical protein n=1 Tax=Streptomyces lunaelactis TaxID=1535768 RepID=UPI001584F550|nr:hypothetical protein [Streptomyces lunaelactis]NUK37694.1 hypothetical protein [Streptomyces lunaelactis]NUK44457.1 hypothetical protein [Streptomyces lunaelactis]
MKFPVDDDTLTAWATLLGLTEKQPAEVLNDIEESLRRGYTFRPLAIRHLTFEEVTADMDIDEFALMYLTFGLHRAGQDELADDVMGRALAPATDPRRTL